MDTHLANLYQNYRQVAKLVADLYLRVTPKDIVDTQLSKPFQNNEQGMTWLHVACNEGFEEIVDAFINREGSRKYINTSDYNGNTPLRIACVQGFFYIAMILMERGATVDTYAYETISSHLYSMKQSIYDLRLKSSYTKTMNQNAMLQHAVYHSQNNYNRLVSALQHANKTAVTLFKYGKGISVTAM